MKKFYVNQKHHTENLFIATALIGVSMVISIELINQKTKSTELWIALYCFAASIPLLTGSIAAMYLEKLYEIRAHIWYLWICNFFGCSLSIFGICAVFFNFNKYIGILFLAACIFSLFVIVMYTSLLEKINTVDQKENDEVEVK